MAVTQENRKIQVVTPLGENVLLFYQMHGRESLNEPFEYQLELLSDKGDIDPAQLLGKNITVSVQLTDGTWRYFHGCVTRFGQYANLNVFNYYRATLRPWLWFLTRASNCRIFQNKSAPDIIKQVFRDQGFSDFKDKLSGSYATREYCVQYRETDFNFVSRLMEEEGICYHFSHEKGKHDLVLTDANTAHDKFPGYEKIPYHVETGTTDRSRTDHIREWGYSQEIQPGLYELTDYDFKKPKANLLVKSNIKESHSHAQHEFFDYPGRYAETGVGDNLVRQRIEEHHARFERGEGRCNARGLAVGYRFTLEDFPRKDQNQEYLVVSADYRLLLDEYFSQTNASGESNIFDCSFTALENKRPYRPVRNTPKPLVQGEQTATVVGPDGEEIYTDKYGRVKVHFHWDRKERWEEGKKEEDSSCWIRVSHPWAGKGWGAISIPRIGQEVIVSFLEGDPDQPIITGRVYNADAMSPYPLPGAAVISGIKSNTHKGKGYNEMSMDDTAGKEKITIHGQYDMNTTVEHDQTNTVNHDSAETIKNNAKIEITEGTYKHDVKTGTADYHVKSNITEKYDANQSTTVNQTITIVSQTANISVKAATKIELEVGASKITMDSAGKISIDGVSIAINGSESVNTAGGRVVSEAQTQHETKGAIVSSSGTATNTVKGGMVMLNP